MNGVEGVSELSGWEGAGLLAVGRPARRLADVLAHGRLAFKGAAHRSGAASAVRVFWGRA